MSNHTIVLSEQEELIYQKYLTGTSTTDEAVMVRLKNILSDQVVQTINEAGHAKFDALSVANKIAFIGV